MAEPVKTKRDDEWELDLKPDDYGFKIRGSKGVIDLVEEVIVRDIENFFGRAAKTSEGDKKVLRDTASRQARKIGTLQDQNAELSTSQIMLTDAVERREREIADLEKQVRDLERDKDAIKVQSAARREMIVKMQKELTLTELKLALADSKPNDFIENLVVGEGSTVRIKEANLPNVGRCTIGKGTLIVENADGTEFTVSGKEQTPD